MLILQSYPIYEKSQSASRELLDSCTFNSQTNALQNEYKKLRELRETGLSKDGKTECAALSSVAECKGFVANDYTSFLEYAEQEFMCSGLCVLPQQLTLEMPTGTTAKPAAEDPYTTVS